MKKSGIIISVAIMICVMLSASITGCKEKEKNIDIIIVRNYYMSNYTEDKIDLTNKKYWTAGPINNSLDVEEYTFVCDLDEEKISDFLRAAKQNKFLSWEKEYILPGSYHDGHQWSINICFNDLTVQESYGDNDYPDAWDEMLKAFKELTDNYILGEKSSLYERRIAEG